jgi:hypothetical protein
MGAMLLAMVLGGTGMLELSTACSLGYDRKPQTAECTALLGAYTRFLATVEPELKPESQRLDEVKQDLLPGRVLVASGWTNGGHRRLERLVLRVGADGKVEVFWVQPRPLSADGERQQVTDVSVCALEAFLDFMKGRRDPSAFDKRLDRFRGQLTSVRAELLAPVKDKPTPQRLTTLAALLVTVLEKAPPVKALTSVADVPSKPVRALLDGKPPGNAAWVGPAVKFEPFTVSTSPAAARGMVWGGEAQNQLLRIALELGREGFSFEREFVAFERQYIE